MFGVVLCESSRADFGAFFLASFTYLDMCGHATIGLAVTLDAMGLIAADVRGRARFTLEVPAGIITVEARYEEGRIAAVTFDNVPAFVAAKHVATCKVGPDGQPITVDIAYGGNWYALVEARAAGVDLTPSGTGHAMSLGAQLKTALNARIAEGDIEGVHEPLDSILFWRTEQEAGVLVSRQLVVMESIKFDRSPCGTGTSARLAQMMGNGTLEPGQQILSRNVMGVDFVASARPIEDQPGRVQPTVAGTAHITGYHTFLLSTDDPLPDGFLCR